jgi:hypothetical protein
MIRIFYNPNKDGAQNRIFRSTFLSLISIRSDIIFTDFNFINNVNIDTDDILIFCSSDPNSQKLKRSANRMYLCICDIYNFEIFKLYNNIFDGFFVPSSAHKNILQYLYGPNVHVLMEAEDPSYSRIPSSEYKDYPREIYNKVRVAWFGYSESFDKSMAYLVPALELRLKNGTVSRFNIYAERNIAFSKLFHYEKFDEKTIATKLSLENNYCILSHIPFDLNLNTLIKSDNKLISAINCGLIPICSYTPNYKDLMDKLGLSKFLFKNSDELISIIDNLDLINDTLLLTSAKLSLANILSKRNIDNSLLIDNLKIDSCSSISNIEKLTLDSKILFNNSYFYKKFISIFNRLI